MKIKDKVLESYVRCGCGKEINIEGLLDIQQRTTEKLVREECEKDLVMAEVDMEKNVQEAGDKMKENIWTGGFPPFKGEGAWRKVYNRGYMKGFVEGSKQERNQIIETIEKFETKQYKTHSFRVGFDLAKRMILGKLKEAKE